jgi:hypothetical protein
MQVVFLRTLIVVMPRRFCAFLPYKKRQHHARRYVPKGASLSSGSGPGCIGDCTSAPVGPGALCTTVSAGVSVAICCFYWPLLFLTRSRLWTVIHGRAWWAGRPALRFARRGGGGFALRPVAAGRGWAPVPGARRSRPPPPPRRGPGAGVRGLAVRSASSPGDREDFSFREDFSCVWHEFLSSGKKFS